MLPVYLVNGFLDSGKTSFIQFTLSQPYFQSDQTTLYIQCEQGDIECPIEVLVRSKTVLEVIDEEHEFTSKYLLELEKKHQPERIIIEWNSMWNRKSRTLPFHWKVEQQITCIYAQTFSIYLTNMRSMIGEMTRESDLVLMNRCDGIKELSFYKRSLMMFNQKAELIFEDSTGEISVVLDEDLPYDLKKDTIELTDETYPIWYIDAMENTKRYVGKKVVFVANVMLPKNFPPKLFVPGRMVMTCCADDMTFVGYVCRYDNTDVLEPGEWVSVEASISYEYMEEYRAKGPVLTAITVDKIEYDKDEVIRFVG